MTTRPMSPDEYDQAVAELTAFARAHMALGHPPGMPARECLTCPWIERRRQELARPVPDVRYWPGLGRWGLVRAFWEGVMWSEREKLFAAIAAIVMLTVLYLACAIISRMAG